MQMNAPLEYWESLAAKENRIENHWETNAKPLRLCVCVCGAKENRGNVVIEYHRSAACVCAHDRGYAFYERWVSKIGRRKINTHAKPFGETTNENGEHKNCMRRGNKTP